jgi:hypothetical protein
MDALIDDPVLGLWVVCTAVCLLLSVIGVLTAWEIKREVGDLPAAPALGPLSGSDLTDAILRLVEIEAALS